MKTIVLFGFLLSMTVLIAEADLLDLTGSTRLCKEDGSLIPGILDALIKLLSDIASLIGNTEKIVTDLCKENSKATVCDFGKKAGHILEKPDKDLLSGLLGPIGCLLTDLLGK
ncbi:UNVERIFIED_CONTAM: hypothetical protein RMT77_001271 [Armadillidium vulgare]